VADAFRLLRARGEEILKKLIIVLVAVAAVITALALRRGSAAPRVEFAKAARETISNTISTNGKVEPSNYVEVHVDTAGLLSKLHVHQGDTVSQGQVIGEISLPGTSEDVAAAEARLAQSRAELATMQAGGRSADIADIDANLKRLRTQRDAADQTAAATERLAQANAATAFDAQQARQTVHDLDEQISGLTARRGSLVSTNDVSAADARVREAEAGLKLAQTHAAKTAIRAPLSGTVYDLAVREGAYLNMGDKFGSIGVLDPVRVRVYVDEPDLGRIAKDESLRITWDALPGKEWTGAVEKKPTEVVALGTRQVGEVLCTVANPNHELVPGVNVNSFILIQTVNSALVIPRTALRHENGQGVFVLKGNDAIEWRPVKTGATDALRVEVTSGLNDGDRVALPTDIQLKDGMKVEAGTAAAPK
jgi:multidrug efflux pump subunit AcrA (membrane-fusion protein)